MRHGEAVAEFERRLADYCGAKHCVAASNGTVTLQAALIAIGVKPGDKVFTTAMTMAATSIAILNVGAVPVYGDVDPETWLLAYPDGPELYLPSIPVSLYGLHQESWGEQTIDDAAQTLRKHNGTAFTSLSFQRSKILNTGEGGALLTDDADLAEAARSYLSLGYRMNGKARIDSAGIKAFDAVRHVRYPSINGRMNDFTATCGLGELRNADFLCTLRAMAVQHYREAIQGCSWLTPQHVPEGWTHDYWTYAVACDTPARAKLLQRTVVKHGGEMPYACWALTYREPAFRHLAPDGTCPVAESLQPRLLQFQCNDLASAEQNARALRQAIEEIGA